MLEIIKQIITIITESLNRFYKIKFIVSEQFFSKRNQKKPSINESNKFWKKFAGKFSKKISLQLSDFKSEVNYQLAFILNLTKEFLKN